MLFEIQKFSPLVGKIQNLIFFSKKSFLIQISKILSTYSKYDFLLLKKTNFASNTSENQQKNSLRVLRRKLTLSSFLGDIPTGVEVSSFFLCMLLKKHLTVRLDKPDQQNRIISDYSVLQEVSCRCNDKKNHRLIFHDILISINVYILSCTHEISLAIDHFYCITHLQN